MGTIDAIKLLKSCRKRDLRILNLWVIINIKSEHILGKIIKNFIE